MNVINVGAPSGDVTKSTQVPTPEVVPTCWEELMAHGPHGFDNTVYGGDPYAEPVSELDSFPSETL